MRRGLRLQRPTRQESKLSLKMITEPSLSTFGNCNSQMTAVTWSAHRKSSQVDIRATMGTMRWTTVATLKPHRLSTGWATICRDLDRIIAKKAKKIVAVVMMQSSLSRFEMASNAPHAPLMALTSTLISWIMCKLVRQSEPTESEICFPHRLRPGMKWKIKRRVVKQIRSENRSC